MISWLIHNIHRLIKYKNPRAYVDTSITLSSRVCCLWEACDYGRLLLVWLPKDRSTKAYSLVAFILWGSVGRQIAKIMCLKLYAPLGVQSLPREWGCNNVSMLNASLSLFYSLRCFPITSVHVCLSHIRLLCICTEPTSIVVSGLTLSINLLSSQSSLLSFYFSMPGEICLKCLPSALRCLLLCLLGT